MDIFFQEPGAIPLPPDEVKIIELRAEPWSDNRRVKVYLELTPFLKRPSGEIRLENIKGDEIANVSIIETIDPKMEFTLHIRGTDTKGEYTVSVIIFYRDEQESADEELVVPPTQREKKVVDQAKTKFKI